MKTILGALCGLLLVAGVGITPSPAGPPTTGDPVVTKSSVGGTIESVDPRNLSVTVKTDSGETQSLAVAKKSVLKGVTQGERVRFEMKDGKVSKIVKTAPGPNDTPALQPTKGELGG